MHAGGGGASSTPWRQAEAEAPGPLCAERGAAAFRQENISRSLDVEAPVAFCSEGATVLEKIWRGSHVPFK